MVSNFKDEILKILSNSVERQEEAVFLLEFLCICFTSQSSFINLLFQPSDPANENSENSLLAAAQKF
jgi:hypothetical protein